MKKSDFYSKASPVWAKDRENEMNLTLIFSATLQKADKAVLTITGASYYNVYVNGEFCGVGPARAAHGYFRVDNLPIKLDKDQNEVKIIVMGYAANSFYHIDQPSFLCAEIETEKGVIAWTDEKGETFKACEWLGKIQKVQRYSFQRPFVEVYDYTKKQFAPVELSNTKGEEKYLERGIYYPDYEKENAKCICQEGEFTLSDKSQYYDDRSISNIGPKLKGYFKSDLEVFSTMKAQKINPVIKWEVSEPADLAYLEEDSFVTYDMGINTTGLIGFNVYCDEESEITVVFDEIIQQDGQIHYTRLTSANVIIIKTVPGKLSFLSVEPYTFRYIRIYVKGKSCNIANMHVRRIGFYEIKKKLKSDNMRLNAVFNAAIETFRQNTFDIYMDCPSRERAGWLCDSFFTSRVEHVLTGKSDVERNFIENYILPDSFKCLPEGMLPMCYPSDHYDGVFIPNWAMWFVVELEEYYMRTGDIELIQKAKDKVYALIKYFEKFENEYGLLEKLESWVFVEWSHSNDLVQDVSFPTNMLYAKVKHIVSKLYGDKKLEEESQSMFEAIRKLSYTDYGFFCDNAYRVDGKLVLSGEYTESCQYYAFHTGTASPETYPELWKRLVNDFGFDRKQTKKWPDVSFANAFIGNYLRLDLIAMYESADEILKNIEGYFYYMAEKTGTLWENDGDYASCNHGFASHVLYWFDKFGMIE